MPRNPGRQQQNPNERFSVVGRTVHIHLVPQGEDLTVADATIETNAELTQWTRAATGDIRSLLVKGDRLHVADAHTDATRVTVSGNPGYVEASGMTLWGAAIELEKRTNRLWVDGAGRLTLPVNQGLDGQPLARAQSLTVDWKRRMDFQNATAVFRGSVVARSAQQVLNTEQLEATLTRAIDFSNPNVTPSGGRPDQRLDLASVRSRGRTFLEARQFDEAGQQSTFSQMEVIDLAIDRATGKISALGPGWVRHVSRGAPPPLAPPGGATDNRQPPPAKEEGDEYTSIYVTFRKGIDGNIDRRTVKFFDDTQTIYAPVTDWNVRLDANDRERWGATGMMLEADTLEVREMERRPGGKRGWFELDATDNVSAEGQRFTALGDRLTYAERNDHLVLRGDPAELYRENDAGGPRHETRTNLIEYWFADGRVSLNGGAFNLSLPPAHGREKKPAAVTPRERPAPAVGAGHNTRCVPMHRHARSTATYFAANSFSTASRPVMPGLTPSASAAWLTSRILASNRSSGTHSGLAGVPRAIATTRLNSLAARMS